MYDKSSHIVAICSYLMQLIKTYLITYLILTEYIQWQDRHSFDRFYDLFVIHINDIAPYVCGMDIDSVQCSE